MVERMVPLEQLLAERNLLPDQIPAAPAPEQKSRRLMWTNLLLGEAVVVAVGFPVGAFVIPHQSADTAAPAPAAAPPASAASKPHHRPAAGPSGAADYKLPILGCDKIPAINVTVDGKKPISWVNRRQANNKPYSTNPDYIPGLVRGQVEVQPCLSDNDAILKDATQTEQTGITTYIVNRGDVRNTLKSGGADIGAPHFSKGDMFDTLSQTINNYRRVDARRLASLVNAFRDQVALLMNNYLAQGLGTGQAKTDILAQDDAAVLYALAQDAAQQGLDADHVRFVMGDQYSSEVMTFDNKLKDPVFDKDHVRVRDNKSSIDVQVAPVTTGGTS